MEKQGDPVLWEQISLQASKGEFLKTAAPLVGLSAELSAADACQEQTSLSVPDLEEGRIVERPGKGHALSNCRLQSSVGTQSSTMLEVRGEFIDDRLSRVRFRFPEAERPRILHLLSTRFGPGDDIVLSNEDILETEKVSLHYWRDGDDLWTVETGMSGTVILTHENLAREKNLPAPAKAARKGEPVSLDDIGIGKLDLKADLPSVDVAALPTDSADTGAEPATTD